MLRCSRLPRFYTEKFKKDFSILSPFYLGLHFIHTIHAVGMQISSNFYCQWLIVRRQFCACTTTIHGNGDSAMSPLCRRNWRIFTAWKAHVPHLRHVFVRINFVGYFFFWKPISVVSCQDNVMYRCRVNMFVAQLKYLIFEMEKKLWLCWLFKVPCWQRFVAKKKIIR